jgi:response regulator RpfG family c-di-GMP phosphodiesterase
MSARIELPVSVRTPRLLAVDDEPTILRMISHLVGRESLPCDTATSLREARAALAGRRYDILFLDLNLPDGSGLELLREPRVRDKRMLVVIVTGEHDLEKALQVIRSGAFDFITKPFTLKLFDERLARVVEEWRSRSSLAFYQTSLEALVQEKADQLRSQNRRMEQIYDMTVSALGAALDLRDPETEEHCRRVSENSVLLGQRLGLGALELRNLRWSSYLHDIGKIGIPERILQKTSPLDASEREVIKGHPLLGQRMIAGIDFLQGATDVVLFHHEKFDGSGYPHGLSGGDIPLPARIFAVMDAMDAMTFDRPYRAALGYEAFLQELRLQKGSHFDPRIVDRFLELPAALWSQAGQRQPCLQ